MKLSYKESRVERLERVFKHKMFMLCSLMIENVPIRMMSFEILLFWEFMQILSYIMTANYKAHLDSSIAYVLYLITSPFKVTPTSHLY